MNREYKRGRKPYTQGNLQVYKGDVAWATCERWTLERTKDKAINIA